MSDSDPWWRWFVSGYRANKLVSARAIDEDQAEYVADLYRRDGVRKVQVKRDGDQPINNRAVLTLANVALC